MWPLFTYKVLLVGDARVGKTSVLGHWSRGESPSEPYNATVAPELLTKEVILEGCIVRLQVLDIGFGDPYMTSFLPRYVGGANAVALMYDVSNAATEEGVEHWYEQLRGLLGPTCVFVVAGCKGDLRQAAGIQEKAQAFAAKIRAEHLVTSALSGINTGRIFEILAQELKRRGAVGGLGQAPAPPQASPQARVSQPPAEVPAASPYAAQPQPRAEYVPPAGNPSPMPVRPDSATMLQGALLTRGNGSALNAHCGNIAGGTVSHGGYAAGGAGAPLVPPKLVKLVLLGEPGVGKSSFAQRLAGPLDLPFQDDYIPTAGPELHTRQLDVNGMRVKLQVWDAAAQDLMNDTTICNPVLKGADAAFIMYDVTQRQSMDNLKKWMHLLETQAAPHVVVMLVGNKVDLKAQRALQEDQGRQAALLWRIPFSEYSARRDADVTGLLRALLEPGRRPPHWPAGHDGQGGQGQASEPAGAPAPASVQAVPPMAPAARAPDSDTASKPTWGAWASSFFTGGSTRVSAPQPEEPPPTTEALGPAQQSQFEYPQSLPNAAAMRAANGGGAAPGGLYGATAPAKQIEEPGAASTEVRGQLVGTTDALMGPEPEPMPGPCPSDTAPIPRQEYPPSDTNIGRSSPTACDASPSKSVSYANATAQPQFGKVGDSALTQARQPGMPYLHQQQQQVTPEEPTLGSANRGPQRSPAASPSPPSKPREPNQTQREADMLPRRMVSHNRMSTAGSSAVQSSASEAVASRGYQGQTGNAAADGSPPSQWQMPKPIPVGSPMQAATERNQAIQSALDRAQAQAAQQHTLPGREQAAASLTPASAAAAAAAAAAKAAQEAAAMASKASPAIGRTSPVSRASFGSPTGSPTAGTVVPNYGPSGLQTTYQTISPAVDSDQVPSRMRVRGQTSMAGSSVSGSPPGSSGSLSAASTIMRGTALNQPGRVVPQRLSSGASVSTSASAPLPQRSPGEAMRTPSEAQRIPFQPSVYRTPPGGEGQRIPIQRTPGENYRMPFQGAPDGPAAVRSTMSQAVPAKVIGQQVIRR